MKFVQLTIKERLMLLTDPKVEFLSSKRSEMVDMTPSKIDYLNRKWTPELWKRYTEHYDTWTKDPDTIIHLTEKNYKCFTCKIRTLL